MNLEHTQDLMPLCFDLDGTLGTFGGGYVLLRETLGELWGSAPSAAEVRACQGSTDWEILDELQRRRLGKALTPEEYERFDAACVDRFRTTFHPTGQSPKTHPGIIEGMHLLADMGHRIWLVSGNTPSVLAFKAEALKLDPRVHQLASQPGCSRKDLILRALDGCPGPHLYVGDRPHDREAAREAGVPFLGIGHAVPGRHPILDPAAESQHLLQAVAQLVGFPCPS